MTDETKLQQQAVRGAQAKVLLENELIVEAFKALKYKYIKAWQDTTADERDMRENLYQAVQIVGEVQSHLERLVSSGNLARHELEQLAKRQRPRAA